MSTATSSKMALRYITPLHAPQAAPLLSAAVLPEGVTRLMTSRVVVEVGSADVAESYSCPVFMLQAASSTLRDLLLDVVDTEEPLATTTSSTAGSASDTVVPLPFLGPSTFFTVALYMEHFYGLGADQVHVGASPPLTQAGPLPRWSVTELDTPVEVPKPIDFHVPLRLDDLYRLSAWEQLFVVQRLLGVSEEDERHARLLEDGCWVDAMATKTLSGKAGASLVFLSEGQQRACVDALVQTLEAATRLGITPLQSLCAAVLSNMLVDRSEEDLLSLLAKPSSTGRYATKPSFTAEKRQELLSQFPWLQDGPKS